MLKEGKVVKHGSYQEIVATGFNIKDILDTFNQGMKKDDEGKEKKEFTKEAIAESSTKKKEAAA